MTEQMSKENYEKLKAKLEGLKKRRAAISKAIGDAREHGDLRENSAYHTAKDEQGLNEMRIKELEAKLADVEIVEKSGRKKSDGVTINCEVKIKALDSGQEFSYTIVPEHEADILEDKISPESPIGGALIGAKEGDVIEVEVPRGLVKYKIIAIS
ncbi:MAG TPA: transcription elongation factor GreA [Candidatus Sulfotelmatobacter sp.]|nr:transcription elongation factor GreA [Candidatus Sulfotelmatobacter sp.]